MEDKSLKPLSTEEPVSSDKYINEVWKKALTNAMRMLPVEFESFLKSENGILCTRDLTLEITQISQDLECGAKENEEEDDTQICDGEFSTQSQDEHPQEQIDKYSEDVFRHEVNITMSDNHADESVNDDDLLELNVNDSKDLDIKESLDLHWQNFVMEQNATQAKIIDEETDGNSRTDAHEKCQTVFGDANNDSNKFYVEQAREENHQSGAKERFQNNMTEECFTESSDPQEIYSDETIQSNLGKNVCQEYEFDISFLFEEEETDSSNILTSESTILNRQTSEKKSDEDDDGRGICVSEHEDYRSFEDVSTDKYFSRKSTSPDDLMYMSTECTSYRDEKEISQLETNVDGINKSEGPQYSPVNIDGDNLACSACMSEERLKNCKPETKTQRIKSGATATLKTIQHSLKKVNPGRIKAKKVKKKFIHTRDKAKVAIKDKLLVPFKCKPKQIKHILRKRLPKERLKLISSALCIETFTLRISFNESKMFTAYFTRDGKEFLPPIQMTDIKRVQRVRNLQVTSLLIEVILMVLQQVGVRVLLTGTVLLALLEFFIDKICQLKPQIEKVIEAFNTNDDFQKATQIVSLVVECFNSKLIVDFMKILFKNLGQVALMAIVAETILKISVLIGTGAVAMVAQIMVILIPAVNFRRKFENLALIRKIDMEPVQDKTGK